MTNQSSSAWVVWMVIVLFILICLGIIIWFAIDSHSKTIPKSIYDTKSAPIYITT